MLIRAREFLEKINIQVCIDRFLNQHWFYEDNLKVELDSKISVLIFVLLVYMHVLHDTFTRNLAGLAFLKEK